MDRERGAVDEADDAKAEDLGNAIADDHLVHPVLLLLHYHHYRPRVEADGEKKKGKNNRK